MPSALVTAEAFCYGPASKLNAVCRHLIRSSYECHFIGEATAYDFAKVNADAFTSVTEISQITDLGEIDPGEFDIAVSVMDPFLPVWAQLNDIPCVYVDSLFWFWNWAGISLSELRAACEDVRGAGSAPLALDAMRALPMHVGQHVAHCLATVNCVQDSAGVAERVEEMRHLARFRRVGAIVDLSYIRPARHDTWLATASGLLNPLLPYDAAVDWVRIVVEMIDQAARSAKISEPLILTGNPDVLRSVVQFETPLVRIEPLDHASILRTMNRAIACLSPPGLTTVLECAAYGVPMILLPEQSYGHLANFERLTEGRDAAFPHAIVAGRRQDRRDGQPEDTLAVIELLRQHAEAQDAGWDQMVTGIADGMRGVQNRRDEIVALQQSVVKQLVGRYAGAAEVARCVEEIMVDYVL